MEEGKGLSLYTSPYVEQIEKYTDSLKLLSRVSLRMEEKRKTFSREEIEGMFTRVKERVCSECEKKERCWGEKFVYTYQLGYEILSAVDEFGNELNIETKRKLEKYCENSKRFLKEILDAFHGVKLAMMWTNRMVLSRKGCAFQLDAFADMVRDTAKELEESLYKDERMEKKLTASLKKRGVRLLRAEFYLSTEGKHEVHLTARMMRENCISVRELAKWVSKIMGRRLIPTGEQAQVLGREYMKIICREGPAFYTLHGIARVGKDNSQVCGDNFMLAELPGGKMGVALSDGMGSGEKACKESTLVIELLEELLDAGFPEKTAIQMINTTLVMGREEIHYSTVDMCVLNLYTGNLEILKAGASSTFLKKRKYSEHIYSTSLPIGVVYKIEIDSVKRQMEDGDFIIMVTDGIMDALPVGEQEFILETIIKGTNIVNPKELAQHILQQILNWTKEPPQDDMTVLVIGVWKH